MSTKPDPYFPRILAALPPPPATILRAELQEITGISKRVMERRLKMLKLMGLVDTVSRINWRATAAAETVAPCHKYQFKTVLVPGVAWLNTTQEKKE